MSKTRRLPRLRYAARPLAALACGLLLGLTAEPAAQATWNDADVSEVASALRDGRGVHKADGLRPEQTQFIYFSLDSSSGYLIDFRARLCYAVFRQGVTAIPCRSLKLGYPQFAPLITWEQDGFGG